MEPVREAGLEDLERRPQPPARHPHVVHALDVLGVEDTLRVLGQLGRPHIDDSRRRVGIGLAGIEPFDRPRPGHADSVTAERQAVELSGGYAASFAGAPLVAPRRSRMIPSRRPPLPI